MTLRRRLAVSVMICVLALATGLVGAASAASGTSGSLASSVAKAGSVVRAAGYTPISYGGFDPGNDLSVIIGVLSTSADGHPQRAFLFHLATFIGYDTPQPSAAIRWIWSTDQVVALQYDLYHPDDPMCCPTAGGDTVRYQWNGTGVTPLDPIPSSALTAAAGRR